MGRRYGLTLGALALVATLGCQGAILDGERGAGRDGPGVPGSPSAGGGKPSPGSPGTPSGPGGTVAPANPNAAGLMPLRRLNRREYNNTVHDLLGDDSRPADAFPSDRDGDFMFRRAGLVSTQDMSTLRDAAEALGATAQKNAATLAPCSGDEAACAQTFIKDFGARAYRRPLTEDEIAHLTALYQAGRTSLMLDHAGAVGLLVEGILQAPQFLYHWELGPGAAQREGSLVRLGGYELASRLSYFLWGSMPDRTLFAAAAADQLRAPGDVDAQARRMLGDPRARDSVAAFVQDWLSLDQVADRPKDPAVYPEFKDDLKDAMLAEANAFVDDVVFDGDKRFDTLLTAGFSFVNQTLAPIYGVNTAGTALAETTLDPDERAGILTQAAFLTVTGSTDGSHPVKRGRKIYERLLCGTLPPPPNNVPPPKPASAGGTTRQRFAEHDQSACATGCHSLMDPIGFTFEHYDGIGKYRTMDNGLPVDSASAIELDGKKVALADARDLARALVASSLARGCFATQWFRFATGRNDGDDDRASIQAALDGFTKGNDAVTDLMVAVATSRSFRYRTPAAGEILQ